MLLYLYLKNKLFNISASQYLNFEFMVKKNILTKKHVSQTLIFFYIENK
jgi:hypothetical protein